MRTAFQALASRSGVTAGAGVSPAPRGQRAARTSRLSSAFKQIAAAAALVAAAWQPVHAQTSPLQCSQTRCVISVTDSLAFEAEVGAFYEPMAGHIELSGDAVIRTPAGELPLLSADLVFKERPDLPDVAFELYGTAKAPFPQLPLFAGATFKAQPFAAVGLVTRETLKGMLETPDNKLPLAENPRDPNGDPNDLLEPAYLFFHFATGLAFDMPLGEWLGLNQEPGAHNPFEFSVPGDKSVTFILDPTEPYFFLSQDAREFVMDKLGSAYDTAQALNDQRQADQQTAQADGQQNTDTTSGQTTADSGNQPSTDGNDTQQTDGDSSLLPELGAIAFSWYGGIPFEPQSTWGLPEGAGHFKGNLMVDTTVPLYKFIEATGEITTYVGPDGFEQGANGDVQVSFDLIPNFLNFNFPLGFASAGVQITADEQSAYFSGINSPDFSFLPPIIPFVPNNATLVAGYISSAYPTTSRIMARGEFTYDTSGLRALTGLNLGNLAVTKADLSISAEGVRVSGSTASNLHPSLMLQGSVAVDVYFSPLRPAASFLELRGDMMVVGVGLSPVVVRVDASGLRIHGQFVTPISAIGLNGSITSAGPSLSGAANISIPLGAINKAMDKARAGVTRARTEVGRIQGLIDYNRAIVQAERTRAQAKLRDAQSKVQSASNAVNGLNSAISSHKRAISSYKSQISSKYRWYKRQPWYKKSWAWAKYAAYRAAKTAAISWRYGQIAALNVAKGSAQGALAVAKAALRVVELSIPAIPVDADPRVAGPIAAMHTAKAALTVALVALPDLPDIAEDVGGRIALSLDKGGLRGTFSAVVNGLELAGGTVRFGARPEACVNLAGLGAVCAPF